jgi:hypothetical protein
LASNQSWGAPTFRAVAEITPILHQPAPLVEQVAAPIRAFDLAANLVRQR